MAAPVYNRSEVMRHFILAALSAGAALAQTLVPPAEVPKIAGILEPRAGEKSRYCSVQLSQPKLNYSFRFRFGYSLQLPVSQTRTPGRTGRLVFRMTPEGGGAPAYFVDQFQLASASGKVNEVQLVSGEFFLGEGRYRVQLAYSDGVSRVCRRQWRVEARLKSNERSARLTLPPGAIADRSAARAAAVRSAAPPIPRRLTILMNSDAVINSEVRDAAVSLLESLLEGFWGADIRLVAFVTHGPSVRGARSLFAPEARELLHVNGVKPEDLETIARGIDSTKSGAANGQDLISQTDCWELLADLVHREIGAQARPDLIVFLGVRNTAWYQMPPHFLEGESGSGRRVFYLQYTGCPELFWASNLYGLAPSHRFADRPCPTFDRPGGDLPDAIELTVARLKGETLPFYSPVAFAKAIDSIKHAAER